MKNSVSVLPALPKHPRLYEINTRVWLKENGWKSLDEIPDRIIGEWGRRFDIVWLMGVWLPSVKGLKQAQAHAGLNAEMRQVLPDSKSEDIVASPYAIKEYKVSPLLGGNESLARLRRRMHERGIRLMLDLVPNHMALDHPWVASYPERLVQGSAEDLKNSPQNFFQAKTKSGMKIIAHGRDPYFDGWADTVQINVFSPAARRAMTEMLVKLAGMCDGLRCDMAMLLVTRIFKSTWGDRAGEAPEKEFWEEVIAAAKAGRSDFIFLAEVYWDMEAELQHLGFDYTYDKKLRDMIHKRECEETRRHLRASLEFQLHSARMIENHDEHRAASFFPDKQSLSAALMSYSVPGMRFFYEGQLEGRMAKIPVQLARRPKEPVNKSLSAFYVRLLEILAQDVMKNGDWEMLESLPAWEGNSTHQRLFAFFWRRAAAFRLAVINLAPDQSQTYVRIPLPSSCPDMMRFRDLLSDRIYDRREDEVTGRGMYFDMPGFDVHLFSVEPA